VRVGVVGWWRREVQGVREESDQELLPEVRGGDQGS
jgi:hypothetical protein